MPHFSCLARKQLAFVFRIGLIACALPAAAQTDVLTWHNDNARTGQNLSEVLLTPAAVNTAAFGLLANVVVDGKVDAQPLYVSAQKVGTGTHNVLLIATEHDSVYAADADTGKVLWQKTMLGQGETTSDDRSCDQVVPEIGITATPVIDRKAGPNGTIFLVAMSKDAQGNYYHRLHALDLATGAEQAGSPTLVQAKFSGTGDNSSNGEVVFDAKQYKDRPALLLQNGDLYTSWGSHCDARPYTGWMIAYNEKTLQQTAVFNFSPNGHETAPWNAGAGPAADIYSNIYMALGNGTFDATLNGQGFPAKGDYGNSLMKLKGSNLTPLDYWTMYNSVAESGNDVDLGSGGLMLLPDQVDATGKTRHLAVAAGKDGNLYVADRDKMGHFDGTNDGTLYQQLTGALPGGVWSSPAYFNQRVYYGSVNSNLRSFEVTAALLSGNAVQTTAARFGYPGTTPSISAYGAANGIVWAAQNLGTAVLHAFEAANLNVELYNSNQAQGSRDHFGAGNKFITPTIANGKVYVGTTNSVAIFGMLRLKTVSVTDGDYTIKNSYSQMLLDDPNSSPVSGSPVFQWGANGRSNQEWFLSSNGAGDFYIQNVASRLLLADGSGSGTAGTSLVQAAPTNDDNQLWDLVKSGSGYMIRNKATGLVFEDKGFSRAEGDYLDLAAATGGANQVWTLQ